MADMSEHLKKVVAATKNLFAENKEVQKIKNSVERLRQLEAAQASGKASGSTPPSD